MPLGIFIVGWNDNYGAYIKESHPDDLLNEFSEDDLLAIFSSHSLAESRGIIGLKLGDNSILSYSAGSKNKNVEDQYVIGLILKNDEKANLYEKILPEISTSLLNKIDSPQLNETISHTYRLTTNINKFTLEQRFALLYKNDIQNLILNILRDGAIDEESLIKWISRELKIKINDLDDVISPFEDFNLLVREKISEDSNSSKTYYFLLYDISLMRLPAKKCIENLRKLDINRKLKESYFSAVQNFFKHYEIGPKDIKLISKLISKPEDFQIIEKLRENFISKKKLIETLNIDEKYINKALAELKQAKIIHTYRDSKQITWIFLLTDIQGSKVFAEYLLDKIYRSLKSKEISKKVALRHLKLLKNEYTSIIENSS
ncbi:MAG: hypothetical protein R6U96_00655 [Promethearchaeia archaeon]